jgi:transposase-like protein
MTRLDIANAWVDDILQRRNEKIVRLYVEERQTTQAIADSIGVTRQRVAQILKKYGAADGGAQRKSERVARLKDAHQRILAGAERREEAARLGYVSLNSFLNALRRLGIYLGREEHLPPHGTLARYCSRRHPCRCPECRQANREMHHARRLRGPRSHGTMSSYKNYGCHCQACLEAARRDRRLKRAARLREKEIVDD